MATCEHCDGPLDPRTDNVSSHSSAAMCRTNLRVQRDEARRNADDNAIRAKARDAMAKHWAKECDQLRARLARCEELLQAGVIDSPSVGALYGRIRAGMRDDAFGQQAREALTVFGDLIAHQSKAARLALAALSAPPSEETRKEETPDAPR